ncbi:MAG: respiratory nitrate reductase subunit gamma [Actinomyces sp.]|uniref:respiratory nitrate reductase subunit gamma n=1 Tax=Actinomyces sp. TaxID=29317 RepID=UPI0026DC477A|nr:respiratory nitrate reductase subunit gamma [Actinomyces sp.]MDO4242294.1 respiratory nitrate reductase subunit gamma [Actinomyces sp.]
MSTFEHYVLWTALPYACLVLLVVGLVWRYRTDQFGWTSRSSQWNESRILRWSSPLFHVGFLMVAAGHVVGLAVPASWTRAVGISQHAYHLAATAMGSLAAVMVLVGLAGLLYRRLVVRSVRLATSTNDKIMYVLLTVPVLLGAWATVLNQILTPHGYDYRQTISPWFRSVFLLSPRPELMAEVPVSFKLHIVAGLLLLAVWPFTRLVHAVSAPVGYVTRPYVVYRSRPGTIAATPARRGWTPVSLQGTGNQGPADTAPAEGA